MEGDANFDLFEDPEEMFGDDDDELSRALDESETLAEPLNQEDTKGVGINIPGGTPLETLPGFDLSAGKSWIYPSNMSHRSYQFDIVKSCLFTNTLVCLPTGLGKTFIAAVVMYNFYRWYPQGKIVFMAPTKPLVAQQIEACFYIMGIPQTDTREMTGSVSVKERAKSWASQRVFFLTPQVMSNDLSRGLFPAKEVKLLVVDEAHKAQGEFAYCQVARELARAGAVTRIVALSATPGTDIPNVKAMLQNLYISHIELRHEESPDIIPYTHARTIETRVLALGGDMLEVKEKLQGVMEIYTKKLSGASAVRKGPNPSSYTKYGFIDARNEWRQNPPSNLANHVRGQVEADFATAIKLYHGMELLSNQGLRSFNNFFTKEDPADRSAKRILGELSRIPLWRDILSFLVEKYCQDSVNVGLNRSKPMLSQQGEPVNGPPLQQTTTSHPKMDCLLEVVREHFAKFKRENMETRVIIFSQYRDCVTELVACLSNHKPEIRPMPFIGQAAGSGNKKGYTQKEQLEVVKRFKSGGYNTLVSTCVGEEGLDIGEVDLIVLYDVASSPIRLVQRMGRTGRKRDGRIVVLLTKGQEERKYNQTLAKKKSINTAIMDRERLEHALYPNPPRMIPLGLDPVCHKMKMLVGKYKSKHDKGGNDDGLKTLQGFTKKMSKTDVLNQNCGFLTEADEERWRSEARNECTVKYIQSSQEMWCKEPVINNNDDDKEHFDLSEWNLWQTGPQFRKCVGTGSISSTFSRLLAFMHKEEPVLEEERKELNADISDNQSQMNKIYTQSQIKSSTNATQSKKGNSILNYFRPTQDKPDISVNLGHLDVVIEGVELSPDIADVVHDQSQPMEIDPLQCPKVTRLNKEEVLEHKLIVPPKVSEEKSLNKEDALLNELFDDSGFYSNCSSPLQSPIDIKKLINEPPTPEEVGTFDIKAAIEKVKAKYQYFNSDKLLKTDFLFKQEVVAMPVALNDSSDDMFAEDSFFNDLGVDKNHTDSKGENSNVSTKQALLQRSDRDKAKNGKNEENDEDLQTEVKEQDGDVSHFDLGSPIIVEDDHQRGEKSKMCSINSTPVNRHLMVNYPPAPPDLTPVIPVRAEATDMPTSPILHKRVACINNKYISEKKEQQCNSEDLFDDDDDIFSDALQIDVDKLVSNKSLFSATQLVSIINKSDNNKSSPNTNVNPRKKLSNIFGVFSKKSINDFDAIDCHTSSKNQIVVSNEEEPIYISDHEKFNSNESIDLLLFEQPNYANTIKMKVNNSQIENENTSRNESFGDIPPPPVRPTALPVKQRCPICDQEVEGEINSHIDVCLNRDIVNQLSQAGDTPSPQRPQQNRKVVVTPPSSDDESPVIRGGKRTRSPLCSDEDNSMGKEGIQKKAPSISNDESPMVRAGKRKNVLLSSDDESSGGMKKKEPQISDDLSPMARGGKRKKLLLSSDDESPGVKGRKRALPRTDVVRSGKRRRAPVSSDDDSLVTRVGTRAPSISDDESPLMRGRNKIQVVHTPSPTKPQIKRNKKIFVISDEEDSSTVLQNGRKVTESRSMVSIELTKVGKRSNNRKSNSGKKFLISEAEVSGSGGSEDEGEDGDGDNYDQSFVDDATQKGSEAIMYLKSLKSPQFRVPERKLKPITDDIFSQVPPEEDDYEEDSFIVGSQIEYDTGMDTLDLLEVADTSGYKRKSSTMDLKRTKRRRIIAPEPDNSTFLEQSKTLKIDNLLEDVNFDIDFDDSTFHEPLKTTSTVKNNAEDVICDDSSFHELSEMKEVKSPEKEVNFDVDFDDSFPESASLLDEVANHFHKSNIRDDPYLVKPDLSTSLMEAEKITVIISSMEVNKVPDLISLLKHEHKKAVTVRSFDTGGYIVGREMVVLRVNESEFGLGSNRDKLEERMTGMLKGYDRVLVIVESEKTKPGEKPKQGGVRTMIMDFTVGQLCLAGVSVLYSSSQADTARLLHDLAEQEEREGRGLPRPLKPSVWQEKMIDWLMEVPTLGLGTAIHLVNQFSTLHELVSGGLGPLSNVLSRERAEHVVSFFNKNFDSALISMAPL